MELRKINTKKCLYDPKELGFLEALQELPEFKPRIKPKVNQKALYTYIVLMYDKNSPLRESFPNFWHRKRVSAMAAGFEMKGGSFDDLVEGILLGQDQNVNRMAVRYCLLFHEPDYVALVSYYEMFIQETSVAVSPSEPSEKKQIAANIKFLNKEIEELTRTIFGGDEGTDVKKELYRTATSDILNLRPELIAERLQGEKNVVKSVYKDE